MNELRIYFEGDRRLKPGFHAFLSDIVEECRNKRCRFQLVEAGGTPVADFQDASRTHLDAWNVLLLDWENEGEAAIRKEALAGCDRESVFWMVQVMESWFLADADALKAVFKGNLNEKALRRNPNVEEVSKNDVLDCLKNATGGRYHKVEHGVKLLEKIDPARVRRAASNCERMFQIILAKLR